MAYGGGVGVFKPPPKFQRPSKIVPNSTRLWKLLNIAEFRTPTHQDFRKKGSKILKLPSVRNCFTLAMTNKLVVIINSLKVPKIKKMLLYEMKFLVQLPPEPLTRGLPPPYPLSLCPQPKKFLGTPLFVTARCLSVSWATWHQSTLSNPILLKSVLILFLHVRLVLTSGLFPSPIRATCPAHLIVNFITPQVSDAYKPSSLSLCHFHHLLLTSY